MSNSPSRFHGALLRGLLAVVVLLTWTGAAQANPSAFNPLIEAQNFSIQLQQPAVYSTPQAQALLRKISNQNTAEALTIQSSDPARAFEGNLCWSGTDACAGDARLYDWESEGYGIAAPVLYTARNGAQISGHVWATRSGPRRRPGIVITGGSYGAPERLYWYLAQALAKNGYVVMTWDPQGQGLSDTFGQPPDQTEGVPVQRDGRPFFDGTEDAIDFFLSTPQKPYVPTTSCSSGTSHAAIQSSRVQAKLDNAYNPYAAMLDPTKKIGSVGSSYGAAAVSWVSVRDTRVGAIVALDNIGPPSTRDPQAFPPGAAPCPGHPDRRGDLLTDRTRLARLAKP